MVKKQFNYSKIIFLNLLVFQFFYGCKPVYENDYKNWSDYLLNKSVSYYSEISNMILMSGMYKPLDKLISSQSKPSKSIPSIDFWLPSRIYAVEGIETNVYFDNSVYADFGKADLTYTVSCIKGRQMERCWTFTPLFSDSGKYSFTLSVYYKGNRIASKSDSLFVTTRNAGSGTRNILSCGNSLWAGGQVADTVKSNYGKDNFLLNFVGKVSTMGGNKTEGHSGYKWSDFSSTGRTIYDVKVQGIASAPTIGDNYSANGSIFKILGENITLGKGNIQLWRSSGTTSPFGHEGVLARTDGRGDAIINYSSLDIKSGNPFWNNSTKKLDLKNYLNNSIILRSGDWATFELGINDMFNYFDTASAGLAAKKCVMYIDSLISQFQRDVPGLRIAILMPAPPANQDAFGINYGTSQTSWRYWSNLNIYYKYILKDFDTPLQRLNGVYVLGLGVTLDRLNNVQKASVNVNSRSKTTYWRDQNGVHPANSGYAQYADTYYSFLKWYK